MVVTGEFDSNASERERRMQERFSYADELLELCLATRIGDDDWQSGVYAEVHGSNHEDAIIAVPPLLQGLQMFPGTSEYNHSVFDDVGIAAKEQPIIYDIVTNKLALRQASTKQRGILAKQDDGTLSFGVLFSQGKIDTDLFSALKKRYGISRFYMASQHRNYDFDPENFGQKPEVHGELYIHSPKDNPEGTGIEVGHATYLDFIVDGPSFSDLQIGRLGSMSLSAYVATSGHSSHTQLIDALHSEVTDVEDFEEINIGSHRISFGDPNEN